MTIRIGREASSRWRDSEGEQSDVCWCRVRATILIINASMTGLAAVFTATKSMAVVAIAACLIGIVTISSGRRHRRRR
jgi:hypothetical protein